jgi:hypothetical protein
MKMAPLVLLLVDRRRSQTMKFLKDAGYRLLTTFTPDHAVAICVSNHGMDAVVLDQDHFVETDGWSVAKSLKMVCRTLCVILVVRGTFLGGPLPDGVDAIVREHDRAGLLKTLKQLNQK